MPMISPAILPASAQLLLAIDPHSELGGGAGLESPFSVLLDAEIDAALAVFASEIAPVPGQTGALLEILYPASGKITGKPDGKILPNPPQLAARAVPDAAAGSAVAGAAAAQAVAGDRSDASPEVTRPDVAALLAVLPAAPPNLIAMPIVTLAVAATPGRTARAAAQPLAVPAVAPAVAEPLLPQSNAPAPEAPPLVVRMPGQRLLAAFAEAPGQQPPADPVTANAPVVRIEQAPATVPMASAAPIQTAGLSRAILVPIKLPGSTAPAITPIAEPQPADSAPPAAPLLAAPVRSATVGLAVLPQRIAKLSGGEAREAAAAAGTPAPVPSVDPGRPVVAPSLLAPPESLPPIAASQSAAPVPPPAMAAVPASPAQHDFAALIDRLVEARQAAQTSLAAQTVTAAITHAEFGQVSLQFRQDADGLSVVMAGADPDLARAVQVAAPAAQTGTQTGGNDNHAAPRQDSTGQPQTQAQNQAQTQQQRGQSPQHRADDPRGSANPSPRQRSQEDSSARGGIFA